MADNDKRIESLEDEVKVLKGEVKRTLVDLRALLMREDSPLNEAASSRRTAAAPKPPAEPPVKKEVVMETVQHTVAAAPPPPPEPKPAPTPPPPPVAAAPPPKPEPALMATPPPPQPSIPPVLATAGPGPGPGPGRIPAAFQGNSAPWPGPQYPAPPGPPPQDQHLAEQERRLAQQERTLAQQERDLAQRTRDQARDDEDDRPRRRAKRNRGDDEDRDEPKREPKQELPAMTDPTSPAFPWSPGPQLRPSDTSPPNARDTETEQPRRRDDRSLNRSRRPREEEDDDFPPEPSRNGQGSRVFEEYWNLLDEATVQAGAEETPGASPVDVNVIASLVYWVSTAKRRLGDQKLKELLELYLQSGHSRPGLQELLLHLHSIVAPAAEDAGQGNLAWVDLMFQLHGILTGGLPIGRMPAVALTPKPAAERAPEVPETPAAPEIEPQPAPAPAAPQTYGRATPPPMVAVE